MCSRGGGRRREVGEASEHVVSLCSELRALVVWHVMRSQDFLSLSTLQPTCKRVFGWPALERCVFIIVRLSDGQGTDEWEQR